MDTLSHVVFPAKLEHLETLVDYISGRARDAGFDSKRVSEMQIAAEEALVNVMHYAYGSEEGGVEVACGPNDSTQFIIEIADSGVPFNPLSMAEPDTSADVSHRKIGGLGILLIKKLMDEVRYRHEEGRNILTLVAHRGNVTAQ
jgi:serine/threonine-protein kinase RsbW